MSDHVFWIIICSIICLTVVMLASIYSETAKAIVSSETKDNEDNDEELSDEDLKKAADILGDAIYKELLKDETFKHKGSLRNDIYRYSDYLKEDKNGRSEERDTEG